MSLIIKRIIDIITSIFLLIVLGPLFLIISLLIKYDSPGPVFYHGIRTGRNNIPFKIKWIINIDKTKICPSNQDETVINLKRLLNGYDIEFIISKKPSFFIAFKNLVIKATEYLNIKSVIFNLEDDWIVNDSVKFDLFDIIQKYHSYNSYISLVFNKFCTLPPCLIGFEIFKHYILN